jgi:hypothetical protein
MASCNRIVAPPMAPQRLAWPALLGALPALGLRASDLDAGNRASLAYDAAIQPGASESVDAAYVEAAAGLKRAVSAAMGRTGEAVLAGLSTGEEILAVVIVQLGTGASGVELVKFYEPDGKSHVFPWDKFGIVHAALVEPAQPLPSQFEALLKQSRMVFRRPAAFSPAALTPSAGVAFHHAIALSEPRLEIRYQIVVPLAREPGYVPTATVAPEAAREGMLTSLIFNASERVLSAPNPLPLEAVRREFGADWGAVSRLAVKPSVFGGGFRECLLLALQRQDAADAYVFFLFDDFERAKGAINDNFYTLRFAP